MIQIVRIKEYGRSFFKNAWMEASVKSQRKYTLDDFRKLQLMRIYFYYLRFIHLILEAKDF